MQYVSRIYIKFGKHEDWDAFVKSFSVSNGKGEKYTLKDFIEDPFASYQFFENGADASEDNLDCIIEACYDEEQLSSLFTPIVEKVKDTAIACADSYCYSCYPPFSVELYSLGNEIHYNVRNRGAEKHSDIDIKDVNKWIGATQKKALSDEEKNFLKQIMAVKKG